jgi:hypothetical protein
LRFGLVSGAPASLTKALEISSSEPGPVLSKGRKNRYDSGLDTE